MTIEINESSEPLKWNQYRRLYWHLLSYSTFSFSTFSFRYFPFTRFYISMSCFSVFYFSIFSFSIIFSTFTFSMFFFSTFSGNPIGTYCIQGENDWFNWLLWFKSQLSWRVHKKWKLSRSNKMYKTMIYLSLFNPFSPLVFLISSAPLDPLIL